MITGFHVSRDKRFDFAALAGTKHAWLEWWNKDAGKWQRIDATPPSQEEEKDDRKSVERQEASKRFIEQIMSSQPSNPEPQQQQMM